MEDLTALMKLGVAYRDGTGWRTPSGVFQGDKMHRKSKIEKRALIWLGCVCVLWGGDKEGRTV